MTHYFHSQSSKMKNDSNAQENNRDKLMQDKNKTNNLIK